ncbi:hypothetical protein ACG33_09720 [Steroidobacter denitrificans]|uniref:Uncharacterized protein n=1 Tax=Steroidobacter denitrificans TaxID=465721 RepID=A0A127FCR5_STEDE|nr:hypothetical protein ACG33_09720 [Steroidobacter denitrificans]
MSSSAGSAVGKGIGSRGEGTIDQIAPSGLLILRENGTVVRRAAARLPVPGEGIGARCVKIHYGASAA